MDGIIENINETYALVKLPDGRTINMKITNIKDNKEKGDKIKIESNIPPLIE
jgi:uncharacterized OB-fold protein